MDEKPKLAIVGTGISGMACAYHLKGEYSVTLYEKNDYIGGHTNTVEVQEGDSTLPIDTGFMVYSTRTYPNLVRFFDELGIQSKSTSMSFGINNLKTGFEARFTNLSTYFAQRFSRFSFRRWKALLGIQRFFSEANEFLKTNSLPGVTLGEYISLTKPNHDVIENLILPMASAIWSTPHQKILDAPAFTLFSFLKNHGMLGIGTQFQWLTLVNGSRQYRDIIKREIAPFTRLSNGATNVRPHSDGGATIRDSHGSEEWFDRVIIAAHADQALDLLDSPTSDEQELLGRFKYNRNTAILHSDPNVMPKEKKAWASWNYRYDSLEDRTHGSTHYWMNSLQGVSENRDYFVSIDYPGDINESLIHWSSTYEHPRYDKAAIDAQKCLPKLNESGPIYFCGSYFRHGFHEDAYTSALNVCNRLAARKREVLVS